MENSSPASAEEVKDQFSSIGWESARNADQIARNTQQQQLQDKKPAPRKSLPVKCFPSCSRYCWSLDGLPRTRSRVSGAATRNLRSEFRRISDPVSSPSMVSLMTGRALMDSSSLSAQRSTLTKTMNTEVAKWLLRYFFTVDLKSSLVSAPVFEHDCEVLLCKVP